eukprot:5720519-Amphidinium_carterae.1
MASRQRGLAEQARSMVMAQLFPLPPDNKQPWEEDFFRDIFGDEPLFHEPADLHRQLLPTAIAPEPVHRCPAVHLGSPSELIRKRSSARSWAVSGHAARDRAIKRCKTIIFVCPRASVVGRDLIKEASVLLPGSDQQLADVFATKATRLWQSVLHPSFDSLLGAWSASWRPSPLMRRMFMPS